MEITAHCPATASFDHFTEAAACGSGRLEFDVVSGPGGELFAAHAERDLPGALPLTELLPFLVDLGLPLSCDLKSFGSDFACAVAEQLESFVPAGFDLIVCSHSRHDLSVAWQRFPGFLRGWSVPQFDVPTPQVMVPPPSSQRQLSELRASLPGLAGDSIMDGKCDLLMVELSLLSPELLRVVHQLDGLVHAWTVRQLDQFAEIRDLPLDGVITDIPGQLVKLI